MIIRSLTFSIDLDAFGLKNRNDIVSKVVSLRNEFTKSYSLRTTRINAVPLNYSSGIIQEKDLFEKIDPYLFTGYINSFLVAFYEPIPWAKLNNLFWVCFTWSTIFILASFYFFLNQDILD